MSDEKITSEQLKKMQANFEEAKKAYKKDAWSEYKEKRQREKALPVKHKVWELYKFIFKFILFGIPLMIIIAVIFFKDDAEKATAYAKYSGADKQIVQTVDCSQTTLQITSVRNGKLICTQPN